MELHDVFLSETDFSFLEVYYQGSTESGFQVYSRVNFSITGSCSQPCLASGVSAVGQSSPVAWEKARVGVGTDWCPVPILGFGMTVCGLFQYNNSVPSNEMRRWQIRNRGMRGGFWEESLCTCLTYASSLVLAVGLFQTWFSFTQSFALQGYVCSVSVLLCKQLLLLCHSGVLRPQAIGKASKAQGIAQVTEYSPLLGACYRTQIVISCRAASQILPQGWPGSC